MWTLWPLIFTNGDCSKPSDIWHTCWALEVSSYCAFIYAAWSLAAQQHITAHWHENLKTKDSNLDAVTLKFFINFVYMFLSWYKEMWLCCNRQPHLQRDICMCVCWGGGWLGCCSLFLIRWCKQQEELNRKVLQASCYLSSKQWYAVTIPPTSPTTHTHKKNTFLHHVTISQHKLDQFKALFMLPVCFQTQTS